MFGRMFIIQHQQLAQAHDARPIQIKHLNGGTPGRRKSDEVKLIGAPGEVIVPVVAARMIKRYALACDGIKRMRLIRFGTVTSLTGIRQILFFVRAATAFRGDVFSGVVLRRAEIRGETVFAIPLGALLNVSPLFGRDALFSHARPA